MHSGDPVRQQEQPQLPSDLMQKKFELWDEEYTLNALSDLSLPQIKSRKHKFETEVQELLAKHRPSRQITNHPSLAYLSGKPPYNAQEWKEAREMIRNEAQKVRFRIERAKGIVAEQERGKKRIWITKLIKTLPELNFKFVLK